MTGQLADPNAAVYAQSANHARLQGLLMLWNDNVPVTHASVEWALRSYLELICATGNLRAECLRLHRKIECLQNCLLDTQASPTIAGGEEE